MARDAASGGRGGRDGRGGRRGGGGGASRTATDGQLENLRANGGTAAVATFFNAHRLYGTVFRAWTRAMNTRGVVLDEVVLMQAPAPALATAPAVPTMTAATRTTAAAAAGSRSVQQGALSRVALVGETDEAGESGESDEEVLMKARGVYESTDEVLMIRPPGMRQA